MRYRSLHVRVVLLVWLSAGIAARAHADGDGSGAPLAQAGAELADVQDAAAAAAQEGSFVASVRERFVASGAVGQPELEALIGRLNSARRKLRRQARLSCEPPAARTPFDLMVLPQGPQSYDDRFYALLKEQRALRAQATAIVHAAPDAEALKALAVELARAHAAQLRASDHARAARIGRARLSQIVRAATRTLAQREIEPELQRTLTAATDAAEQARAEVARVRAELATLRRLTGAPLESVPRMIATYERAFAQLRAALHGLYADWERFEPLNHMAARYRVQEKLGALPPDASAEDVRKAVLAGEADPPMAY